MECFEIFCLVLGWIVLGGCGLCILFFIIGSFYLLIKKLTIKSTDWDAIEQSKRLKTMVLKDEIKRYTEEKYHEIFGNGQGTLDEFDWEDITTVIEETAEYFAK